MEDLTGKIDGGSGAAGVLPADQWNQLPNEIQNVIIALGQTLSNSDLNQLGKSIAGYVANGTFYTDSGSANAYVLSSIGSKQEAPAYSDGFEVNFIAGNDSSATSTVNVAGLGAKDIKLSDGSDISIEITGRVKLVFKLGDDRFDFIESFPIASKAEAEAGTDNIKGMTPLRSYQAYSQHGLGTTSAQSTANITSGTLSAVAVSGLYFVASAATDKPAGTSEGHLIVNNNASTSNNNDLNQVFIDAATGAMHSRIRISGVYQPWLEFLIGSSDNQVIKAWVTFNGTGTVAILDSFGVSSVSDLGVGNYGVNFITTLADANYSAVATCDSTILSSVNPASSASQCEIDTFRRDTGAAIDPARVSLQVFGG